MYQLDPYMFDTIENQITTLDLHVAGEPIRLIIKGLPNIPGQTMNEKRLFIREKYDQIRKLITREPRGHRNMFAGIYTEPVNNEAAFGIIFMDTRYYPYMCGHGMIGAVTAFIEMGWTESEEGENHVTVDTPAGLVKTRALVQIAPGAKKNVRSVSIQLESAFVFQMDQTLHIPEYGDLLIHIVFAGGFFILVPIDQTGLSLDPKNATELVRMGMAIMEEGNGQLRVKHPERFYMQSIDVVEFYDSKDHDKNIGRSVVILGQGQVDRSPCGTGTAAKLALLHQKGQLSIGETFFNIGPSGQSFEGSIICEKLVGDFPGIIPEIRGSAHLTGLHRFALISEDPFPNGFLL